MLTPRHMGRVVRLERVYRMGMTCKSKARFSIRLRQNHHINPTRMKRQKRRGK